MENYDNALDAALNLVSPDGESYERGVETFHATLRSIKGDEHDVDAAIHFALFAAMPRPFAPEDFWPAYQAFWTTKEQDESSDSPSIVSRAKGWVASAKAKATAPHPPVRDHDRPAPAGPVKRRRRLA